jgi:hypothetical protein
VVRDFLEEFFQSTELPSDLNPFSPVNSDSTSNSETPDRETDEPAVDDEYIIKIDRVTGEDPFQIDETGKVVTVDPTRGDWENSKQELKEYWREEKRRAFTESAFELYLSIQASTGDADEVMNFFRPILSPSQSSMLEEAYHLSKYFDNFNVNHQEEYRRRGKLDDKYGRDAKNVPSLCSAGYFEEHGLLRDLYSQLSDSDTQDEDFQELFDELIRHRPFVVFVKGRSEMGIGELKDFISQKVNHIYELPVDIDYIHVRGMGDGPKEKISDLKEELDEEGAKQVVDVNRKENGPNELVLAIDVSSIS